MSLCFVCVCVCVCEREREREKERERVCVFMYCCHHTRLPAGMSLCFMCVCVYVCMYVCMHECMYVCMYVVVVVATLHSCRTRRAFISVELYDAHIKVHLVHIQKKRKCPCGTEFLTPHPNGACDDKSQQTTNRRYSSRCHKKLAQNGSCILHCIWG